ncbi:aldo/keto reductase [Phenylobacterium sp.]|jgi:aryl-alcohol dehydrogenase-like predicted oxidoreductase|uniref:aldo/keto reductase n=1 Tax=Phenylobacterium sp. TaxID=1871053 RepID=UPI002F41770A
MEQRNIGKSGLRVSLIGLGGNNFGGVLDLEASRAIVDTALDLGVNFIDTSNTYGAPKGASEEVLGQLLASRRHDVVIATKCGKALDESGRLKGGSRRTIMTAVEESLRRLRTDYIDLYYMHDPDPATPIDESLRALDDLVKQGKVRYIGCSNFAGWQVMDASWTAKVAGLNGFIVCQSEYNLLARAVEQELVPALASHGLGLIPYFPLASGLLTGKYRRDSMPDGARLTEQAWFANYQLSDENWRKVEALSVFCTGAGRSMTELALSWLAHRPTVASIIAGATTTGQLRQNIAATQWAMSDADILEIDRVAA